MILKTRRQALSHVGGSVVVAGDADAAAILEHALDVAPADEHDGQETLRPHLHAFHSYPARLHPDTARRLLEGLGPRALAQARRRATSDRPVTVLDPFCGSGTVLLEGALLGQCVRGTDLNPLAVALTELKLSQPTADDQAALLTAATTVAKFADARRAAKAGASHRFSDEDMRMFAPHVLLELDGLRVGIREQPEGLRMPLGLMLSSLLTKFSRKSGDAAPGKLAEKRIAAGYPAKLFRKRTEEFLRLQSEFLDSWKHREPATVALNDATQLNYVQTASIDLVVTSPPYAATYDYLTHHELRLRWLGLPQARLAERELGARRDYADLQPDAARARWHGELVAMLTALARVTRYGGLVALVMADSAVRGGAMRADDAVLAACDTLPFDPIAKASQARPHFHFGTQDAFRDGPRREHVLLLERARS